MPRCHHPLPPTTLQKYDALEEQKSARPTTGPKALATLAFKEFISNYGLWPEVEDNAYIARFRDDDAHKRKRKRQPEPGRARTRMRLMSATPMYVGDPGGSIKGLRHCSHCCQVQPACLRNSSAGFAVWGRTGMGGGNAAASWLHARQAAHRPTPASMRLCGCTYYEL